MDKKISVALRIGSLLLLASVLWISAIAIHNTASKGNTPIAYAALAGSGDQNGCNTAMNGKKGGCCGTFNGTSYGSCGSYDLGDGTNPACIDWSCSGATSSGPSHCTDLPDPSMNNIQCVGTATNPNGGLCCPTSQVCNTVGQCVGSCSTGGANCSTKCCSCANQTCDKNSGDTTYNECLVFSTSTPTSSASLSASPSAATKAAAASSGPAPELCSTYFASFDPPLAIPSGINPNDYCAYPSQIQYLPSFPPIPPFITVNYVCPQFTNYTQNPGVTPIASYINCANTDAVVCTYTYNGPPPPSNYKCDNNMCKLVSNPALYTNEPDCAQADVGKPCCSANYPTPIESLCPANATAKMSYVCCYPGQCYQPSASSGACCSSGASKICGKAPKQVCCNSLSGTNPVQDCMAKTGTCCNEGPYVGDDETMKGKMVSKVCGCGATDTNCTCCGANQSCDTDDNPKTGKPYDICEGMPAVTCSLSPVTGFLDTPTSITVKPGTLCSVSATATSSPTSPDFVYNWTQNIASTPPVNKTFTDGPKAGSSSYTGGYKALYNTNFSVTVWNGVGTSNTAVCKIGVTDKLKIYCFAGGATDTANVDMDGSLMLSGGLDTTANGSPKYTYAWSPSNAVPINSTASCPSNPNGAVTNTNETGVYCDGKATVTASQKKQLCFNPDADPITSTKTISVIDSAGTTASDTCTINIKPQPGLKATCGKQKVVSYGKSTIWDDTLHCYPYIMTLSIPVTVTGQVTSSVTSFCSVKGGNAPIPSLNNSGATVFTPSCTGNAQILTESFKSCKYNFSDININNIDSVTAVSDCQSGSASCKFHVPPSPITVGSVSINDNLTLFLSSLLNFFRFK